MIFVHLNMNIVHVYETGTARVSIGDFVVDCLIPGVHNNYNLFTFYLCAIIL